MSEEALSQAELDLAAEAWHNDLEQQAIEALDKYAECEAFLDVARLRHEEAMENLIPEELKAEMKRLKSLYAATISGTHMELDELRATIDTLTLALQHTIKGVGRQAVWNKARTSWDTRALNEYAKTHPEVAALKKVGKPSVSVKRVSRK